MIRWLDRVAMVSITGGILLLVQPWWQAGFRLGFFATIAATLLHIVTSHLVEAEKS